MLNSKSNISLEIPFDSLPKTRAKLSSDKKHYLINGQKMWITNGGISDLYIVFAKIDDDKNLSAFIVEKSFGGITMNDEEKKLGIKGSSTRQIFFNDCKVPIDNLLSERENGFKIALNVLNIGRIKLGAGVLGGCRGIINHVITYSNEIGDPTDDFFNMDIHPEEMDFDIRLVGDRFKSIPQDYYKKMLRIVSSHNNEDNIPGRELRLMVYEKNSNKIVGFIRLQSPLINSKPRNEWLGKPPDLKLFNRHAVMGFAIVPSQPFGYNYLGGKLLALICISHFTRKKLNKVFEKDIALFETTSLYGSSSSASQYDGLKPFMRFKGLTDSKFIPTLYSEAFHELHDHFTYLNNNTPLTDNKASSKKLKRQTKMIAIIMNSLKDNIEEKLNFKHARLLN